MNRPIIRVAVALLGGFAIAAALAVLLIAASTGSSGALGGDAAIPLIAGGAVALLAWFLLSGATREGDSDAKRAMVRCPACGNEVLWDWRLCPYCGGTSEPASHDDASSVPRLS
jgi:ribosomal protein S27AE